MGENSIVEAGLPVALPSGARFSVLTTGEVQYVEDRVRQYTDTYRWDNVSDIQDVDRIVIMELLVYRWGIWLARQKDYWDDDLDERELKKNLGDFSGEIRQLKKAIGIDKATREKESGTDSVAAYLERLRLRAKEFGVNRNKMMDKGLELSQQVIALSTLWENCDEEERVENRCTAEDVCRWLVDVYTPEFQAVDEAFRQTSQKLWVAEQ